MLKGLEISEVLLSDVHKNNEIFRIDSFFFLKRFLYAQNLIGKINNDVLKNLTSSILSFGAYSLNNFVEYQNEGIPFIRGVNMKNGILDFSDVIYITEDANDLLWKSKVTPETLLLSMSGTVGDVAIAMPTMQYPMNSNQDIAKIRVNEKLNVYYLYSFLLSKYGQDYLIREARGSVQQHVYLSQMENFVIPLFSTIFQNSIEKVVRQAYIDLEQSKQLYKQAEDLLLSSLGLNNWTPSNKNVSIKSYSDFVESGRLDAEYYQPKYDDIEQKITSYQGGWDYVANCCYLKTKLCLPTKGSEYKYIELSNIGNQGEINGCLVDKGENLPSRARRLVETNDVMVSYLEGSLKSVAIVPEEYNNSLCSTGFHLVKPKYLNAETLLVLFKLPYIQSMLQKCCNGSIMSSISLDEFSKIKLPLIESSLQNQISDLIQESFTLKSESKQLLEDAKRMVELEIEKGGE